jgi:hypothetical protein
MARNDILAEAAGISAGYWYAWPTTDIGRELIAAGMLIMAGAAARTRVGFERGMRSRKGER